MFLHILSLTGIVLLCIAAFVLLVAALICLVPVRYTVTADINGKDIEAAASVKWLFGAARLKGEYKDGGFFYEVKLLFISLLHGSFGKKEDESEKESVKRKREKKERPDKKKKEERKRPSPKKAVVPGGTADKDKEKEEKSRESEDGAKKLKDKLLSGLEKIKRIWEKLKQVRYIWDAPVTKRALESAKESVFCILGHIKPGKIKGSVSLGFSDPADTALAAGLLSILSGAAGYELCIYADYDEKGVKAKDVNISGRIFIGYMLLLALKILTNKDIKRVVNYIRRNF